MRTLIPIALLLAGCGGSSPAPDLGAPDLAVGDLAQPICNDTELGDAGVPATFAEVQQVFDTHCIACHCCGDTLDLTSGQSYAHLVDHAIPTENGTDETCGGILVTPGDPSRSYLYHKLTDAKPCAGAPMPLSEFQPMPLPACELDLVRRWILAGASP